MPMFSTVSSTKLLTRPTHEQTLTCAIKLHTCNSSYILDYLHHPRMVGHDAKQNLQLVVWSPMIRRTRMKTHKMLTISTSSSSTASPVSFIFQPITEECTNIHKSLHTATISPKSSVMEKKYSVHYVEEVIEQAIFNSRFLTLMAVLGSLTGSILCFFKGCTFVIQAFVEYFQATTWDGMASGNVILKLVEAVDVYLMGTVMLIFGMGLYDLFVNSLDVPASKRCSISSSHAVLGSNLFGLFRLRERPKWLEIHSLDELKTKIGHVIVMILLVGMFEKSKKVPVHSVVDLLCFSTCIFLSSGCLFLLSKLRCARQHDFKLASNDNTKSRVHVNRSVIY